MQGLKSEDKEFWESKYIKRHMPWDIGKTAPAFVKYFSAKDSGLRIQKNLSSQPSSLLPEADPPMAGNPIKKVCVLGCGLGHDAFYFAENGFETYGFDFAKAAITYCNNLKKDKSLQNIFFYESDFFNLIKEKKWYQFFDYVIEHTSFCAINPKKRKEYINLINFLLKPKGELIGLFFLRPKKDGGPPYGTNKKEIRGLLKENFREKVKLHFKECLHGNNLDGKEFFGVFEKNEFS